jgi:UDPglucose 6-dehydrogenase
LRVLNAVEEANERQKRILSEKITARFGTDLKGRHFAIWGLAFKPNTDDMREATSRVLIGELLDRGATVSAYDPAASAEAQRIFGSRDGLKIGDSAISVVKGADALVVVTEWKEFRSPDFAEIKQLMKQPVVFDGRNLYSCHALLSAGFEHYSIGRPAVAEVRPQ